MAHAHAAGAARLGADAVPAAHALAQRSLDGVEDGQKRLVFREHGQVAEQLVAAAHLHARRVLQYNRHDLPTHLVLMKDRNRDGFGRLEIVGEDDEIRAQLFCSLHPVPLLYAVVTRLVIAGADLAVWAVGERGLTISRITAGDGNGTSFQLGMVQHGDLDEVAIHVDMRVDTVLSRFVYFRKREWEYEWETHRNDLSPTPAVPA